MMLDTAPDLRGASVLLVDDTPENLGVLRGMLNQDGYQLFAAISGEQAIRIARQFHPDLILLDVNMPGMDGFETCRRLKGDPSTQDIPVVFVTARIDTPDAVAGFRAGAVDYISKPIRREEVCARVRTHIQNSKLLIAQREQTEHFRAIVNNMTEGLMMLTPEGKIRFVNPACMHLLGMPAEALVGCSIAELLPPVGQELINDMTAMVSGDHKAFRTAGSHHGIQLKDGSGSLVELDFSLSPVFLREPLFIGLFHDISEHKASQVELQHMIHNDPLTGISNRRHLDEFIAREWQRAQRSGKPIALAMLDVDHFKLYNDALGHPAGDRCLQKIATEIRSHARRATDLAARYGGEEFALVFAEADAAHVGQLAEGIRHGIEALALPHPKSPTAPVVTISVGMAVVDPRSDHSSQDLFAKADRALYQAKKDGRNRTVVID